jgi:hypothetical protein
MTPPDLYPLPSFRALFVDQTSWLPDNLLERGDRMMAGSIEDAANGCGGPYREFARDMLDAKRHSSRIVAVRASFAASLASMLKDGRTTSASFGR